MKYLKINNFEDALVFLENNKEEISNKFAKKDTLVMEVMRWCGHLLQENENEFYQKKFMNAIKTYIKEGGGK